LFATIFEEPLAQLDKGAMVPSPFWIDVFVRGFGSSKGELWALHFENGVLFGAVMHDTQVVMQFVGTESLAERHYVVCLVLDQQDCFCGFHTNPSWTGAV
jgi:hypothetical protein